MCLYSEQRAYRKQAIKVIMYSYVFVEDLDTFFVHKTDPNPDRLKLIKLTAFFLMDGPRWFQAGRIRKTCLGYVVFILPIEGGDRSM
jgi:hypothetical protein